MPILSPLPFSLFSLPLFFFLSFPSVFFLTVSYLLLFGSIFLSLLPHYRSASCLFLPFLYPFAIPVFSSISFLTPSMNSQLQSRCASLLLTPAFMR
ncbi:hypothetical protein WH91_21735, partial [Devosia psychrophila]